MKRRITKNEKRRLKKKLEKKKDSVVISSSSQPQLSSHSQLLDELSVKIEYISQDPEVELEGDRSAEAKEFRDVFKRFKQLASPATEETSKQDENTNEIVRKIEAELREREQKLYGYKGENSNGNSGRLSKKERKRLKAESVSLLKQEVERADLVEAQDVNSPDPQFLVYLKGYKNSVAVPKHWCAKHRYLQQKKTLENSRYQLPEFISETGVYKIQESVNEEELAKKNKRIARERIRPKLGRLDINYQKLHDAFFKHQQKYYLPQLRVRLKKHGEMYYENMENESIYKHRKMNLTNNKLSANLKEALGLTNSLLPPPWLINMQRYGPPPSYPNLKIPGLNAPIPKGASFGFHPGGWGKPPIDQFNRPVYGYDVFLQPDQVAALDDADEQRKVQRWGEFEEESEPEENEDMDEDDEEEQVDNEPVVPKQVPEVAIETETSLVEAEETNASISAAAALAIDRELDLRKGVDAGEAAFASAQGHGEDGARALYQVLEQKSVTIDSKALHGSSYIYNINVANSSTTGGEESEKVEDKDLSSVLSKARDVNKGSSSSNKDKESTSKNTNPSYANFKF